MRIKVVVVARYFAVLLLLENNELSDGIMKAVCDLPYSAPLADQKRIATRKASQGCDI